MKEKQTLINNFFDKYEEAANTFDVDLLTSLYADAFMGGGPAGTTVAKNDDTWRKAISQRKTLFNSVGFQKAKLLGLEQNWLDDHFVLAKTKWRMSFRKKDGSPVDASFDESYFLYVDKASAKVVFFLAHEDEAQTMKDLGLM